MLRMNDERTKQITIIVLILMIFAAFFHIIQLFLIPIDFKWFVALTGFILYTIACMGVYKNKKFGYYISIIFPIFGGISIISVFMIVIFTQVQLLTFDIFTALAAIVEIPAVILSIIVLKNTES